MSVFPPSLNSLPEWAKQRIEWLEAKVNELRAALAAEQRGEATPPPPEDLAFLDAAIDLWLAKERVRELDAETGALQRDRDGLDESMRRFMRAGNVARLAEAKRDAHPPAAERGGEAPIEAIRRVLGIASFSLNRFTAKQEDIDAVQAFLRQARPA